MPHAEIDQPAPPGAPAFEPTAGRDPAAVGPLDVAGPGGAGDIHLPRSRRALLAAAVGGAAAFAASALGRPLAARAATGDAVIAGYGNTAGSTTTVTSTANDGLQGVGNAAGKYGIVGVGQAGGVFGASGFGDGVRGESNGPGVRGFSYIKGGVVGQGPISVHGYVDYSPTWVASVLRRVRRWRQEVRPMYGTIARIHPKPGREAELRALLERYESGGRRPAGYRHSYMFRPDTDPYDRPTWFLIAVFDDAATYRANADSPEQDAEYREMLALLEDEPDWMDGTFDGV